MPASAPLILVSGEALIDVIPDPAQGDRYIPRLGGSPFNTAIALGRLGALTAFVAALSRDAQGEAQVAALRASNVRLDFIERRSAPSPLAWVTPATGEQGTRYAFYLAGTAYAQPVALPDPLPANINHLHFGSFAALVGKQGAMTLSAMQRARGRQSISYDPNIRPLLLPGHKRALQGVEERVRLATIVKASEEDFAWLYPERDPLAAAQDWAASGPKLVVLTRGGDGAVALFGGKSLAVKAPDIVIADTIGAGDSFMAGLLAGMHDDKALGARARAFTAGMVSQWLDLATRVAAINCTRAGANPPWLHEL